MDNKLMSNVNFKKYVKRMEGVTDKTKLLELVPNKAKVLDYGCGTGVLAKNFSPYFYVGYDLERGMLRQARALNPGYSFTHVLEEVENIDAIIYSSLLHEVYSYNNNSKENVIETLIQGRELINDGGCLIIRDGIMDDNLKNNYVNVKLIDAVDGRRFLEELKKGPQSFSGLTITGDFISGDFEILVNFLNIYTWGWESLERERNERVNFATLTEWRELFEKANLNIEFEEVYSQESYFEHLGKLIHLNTLPKRWSTKVLFKLTK